MIVNLTIRIMGGVLSSLIETESVLSELPDPRGDEECALLITGICDSWSEPRFEKFLKRLNLRYQSVVKHKGEQFAVVRFSTNQDRRLAYKYLEGCELGNSELSVKPYIHYDAPPMPFATQAEILKFSNIKTQTLHERLFPMEHLSPADRVQRKKSAVKEFTKDVNDFDLICHEYNDPQLHTCKEFLVGFDEDGNIAVGFNKGSKTNATIVSVDETFHLPDEVVTVARTFADFVDKSLFPPFDRNSDTGKWKSLVIRYTANNDLMMIVVTFGGLPLTESERLIRTFSKMVTSLYWVKSDRTSYSVASPNRVLCGAGYIMETLAGMKFSINPFAPFPSNITAYQRMIERICEIAQLKTDTVFVDLACGIGTACTLVAPHVKRTVGIDMNELMIDNAKKNIEINGVKNAYFAQGNCDRILQDVTNNTSRGEKVVCFMDVMNPGHPSQDILSARKCAKVDTFIYVTECAYTFSHDCQRLLLEKSGRYEGSPFTLSAMELWNFDELSNAVKIVGIFTRASVM